MALVPLEDIWATANFKETQLRHMSPGQRVVFTVDAYDRRCQGHVTGIGGASGSRFSLLPPENATGNYVKVVQRVPVRIDLDPGENKDHRLRPGMSLEPKVYLYRWRSSRHARRRRIAADCRPARSALTPGSNPWLVAVVVAVAAFMEVLDTSIANVAPPYIAGALPPATIRVPGCSRLTGGERHCSSDQRLVAVRFGRKHFFLLCIFPFTLSSVLCGSAPSLAVLIVFRALQGAGGGGLQPMAQTILADTFPPEKASRLLTDWTRRD